MVVVTPVPATINLYRANTLREDGALNGFVVFSHHGGPLAQITGETFLLRQLLRGKTLKFRDEEDLWLMNRKVSINQVVVES